MGNYAPTRDFGTLFLLVTCEMMFAARWQNDKSNPRYLSHSLKCLDALPTVMICQRPQPQALSINIQQQGCAYVKGEQKGNADVLVLNCSLDKNRVKHRG